MKDYRKSNIFSTEAVFPVKNGYATQQGAAWDADKPRP